MEREKHNYVWIKLAIWGRDYRVTDKLVMTKVTRVTMDFQSLMSAGGPESGTVAPPAISKMELSRRCWEAAHVGA